MGEAAQVLQAEVGRVKHVVEGPAQQLVVGVEGGQQPPSDARVEQPRESPEQLGSVRPGHVVEVAGHNGGPVVVLNDFAHHQQLGIAAGAGFRLLRGRRLGVQEVQVDDDPAGQPRAAVKRRDVGVENVANLRLKQRQARKHQHAVGVGQRGVAGVGVVLPDALQLAQPPVVGFEGQHDVGGEVADVAQAARSVAVVHQHVGHHQAEVKIVFLGRAAGVGHLLAVQRRIGPHPAELVAHRHGQAHHKQAVAEAARRGQAQRRAKAQQQAGHDLQAREIKDANPPRRLAEDGQQRGEQPRPAQPPHQPVPGG